VVGCSGLQGQLFGADDPSMATKKETACESCGQPVDLETIVVLYTRDGHKLVRHRHCHMLDLLERA
jgi:hypothetical protein